MKLKTIMFILLCTFVCGSSAGKPGNFRYTDLFIGTAGDHGQVDPAACVPYGMVRVCPDMEPRSHSGYDYDVTRISGFSVNRISGVGCGGSGGNLSLKPAPAGDTLHMEKPTETAAPGYYSVTLSNSVRCELTATHNTAVERFTWPEGTDEVMTFDVGASFVKVRNAGYRIDSDTAISGSVSAGTTCNKGIYTQYFEMVCSRPFKVLSRSDNKLEISFGKSDGKPVEIRIALSPVDVATARNEAKLTQGKNFAALKAEAAAQWDRILDIVDVEGGTAEQKKLFYTSLYRAFFSPGHVTSHDGVFRTTDGSLQKADGFTYYSSWSMWDSYRTKFPIITLFDPEAMRDFCVSLSTLYIHGKQPWATSHESMPTVRTEHSSVVLLDAYEKGIPDIRLQEAYPHILAELETLPVEGPDLQLETSIDLWAAARIAEILGRNDGRDDLLRRSKELFTKAWSQHFATPDTTYTRMKDSGLYQGTRWQYRWAVPQYLDIMAELSGGREVLEKQLTYFFDNDLNNQGNEPGIHAAYIFNRLGSPHKASRIITRMLTEPVMNLYGGNAEYPEPVLSRIFRAGPEGFLPEMDEDDGTMCAWYAFSAMGLFPLVVGDENYEIVSPLFDRVTLNLTNGKQFIIRTIGRTDPKAPVKSVVLNGTPLEGFSIPHHRILDGGLLELNY